MDTILIFTGGDLPDLDLADELPAADQILAADGGYESAVHLGFRVDVLVGDLDSVQTAPLPDSVRIERHAVDKDQTDLDLALELALREDPGRIVVVGGSGGRLDHELATSGLLCSERWSAIEEIDWISSRGRAHVLRGRRIIHGDVGATLSLIPIGGPARGVTSNGLRWELEGDDLEPGSTRGVSNVMRGPVADLKLDEGCLLILFPA